jgi:hypothetical protein
MPQGWIRTLVKAPQGFADGNIFERNSHRKEKDMKTTAFIIVTAILMLSGATLAQQRSEEKRGSPMQGMMEEMMKEQSKGSMQGMSGMNGMMGMMKMMEQCSKMMESAHAKSGKDSHKK